MNIYLLSLLKCLFICLGDFFFTESNKSRFCGPFFFPFYIKIQQYQEGIDNTAVNAIMLECAFKDNYTIAGYVNQQEGPWGSWTEWSRCNEDDFLKSYDLQFQGPQVNLSY